MFVWLPQSVPRRANAAADWAKLAEGGCTSSAFGIAMAEI